jgi:4-hydroxy-tetrahydrodipicolinate reductase
MDSLPLYLTAICQQVDYISVHRVVIASLRRSSFQAKIGCGVTIEQFCNRKNENLIGHVGLLESAGMVIDTMGKQLTQFDSIVEPIIADRNFKTAYGDVQEGLLWA